jgi:filamentous hemagglutinin
MTIGNAMESLLKQDNSTGLLGKTTVDFFGPAYNAADADKILSQLQNRDAVTDPFLKAAMELRYETHKADFVGTIVGGNPATGGTIPDGSSLLKEMKRILGDANTVHSCYGASSPNDCKPLWADSINGIPVLKTPSQVAAEQKAKEEEAKKQKSINSGSNP